MRKLLLATLLLISCSAYAQQASKAIEPYHIRNSDVTTSAKSTIAGSRWYYHAGFINQIVLPNQMKGHLFPIWYDSSVLQNFTTGLAPIEYISAAQIVDPIHFTLYNDINTVSDPNAIVICEATPPYKVDSVSFLGAYIKNPNRSPGVVDTLIFSVSPTSANNPDPYVFYGYSDTDHPWASNYYGVSGVNILKAFTIDSADVDIHNRASNVAGRVIWKIPLTDADRQAVSGDSADVVEFTYPVMVNDTPGVCHIPIGHGVAVTVTFKSGDTIVPNVATFSEYHHFLLWSGEAMGDSSTMPYFYYPHRDKNMSNLMRSGNDSVYYPSVFLEGTGDSSFAYEFHGISAHLACDNCPTLTEWTVCDPSGVKPVFLETAPMIYPNPASEFLTISFPQAISDGASISVINTIGQVVNKTAIAKGTNKATLSTAELPEGIYFYIIRTNGAQTGGHFTVLH